MAVALTINEATRSVSVIVYNNSVGANVIEAVYTGTVTHSTTAWTDLLIGGLTKKVVPASTSWNYDIKISGITSGAIKRWGYNLKGVITRDNAGNMSIKHAPREVLYQSTSTFSVQCVTDNTDFALQLQVSDSANGSDTVKWVGVLNASRVTF